MSTSTAIKAPALPFHIDLFDVAMVGRDALLKANGTLSTRTQALIAAHYGDTPPTYAEFKVDRAALATLAAAKGLKSDQCARKAYNAAVKALFGALPMSDKGSAPGMRKGRSGKSGAPRGETGTRSASATETIEQLIARVGVMATLKALTAILAADTSTKAAAAKLKSVQADMTASDLRAAANANKRAA